VTHIKFFIRVTKSASDQENAKPNSQDETLSEKMEGVPVTNGN